MTTIGSSNERPDGEDDSLLSGSLDLDLVIDPTSDPLIGTVIGDARIIRLIGQGGMGRVYEGYQEKLARTVAVKVVRPGKAAVPQMQRWLAGRADILARLRHPGIAQIYAAGVQAIAGAAVPYFIMEFIADARTLTCYAEDLRLPNHGRLALFESVCEAVAHEQEQGVEHRNPQPATILVDAMWQPRAIDFGVAAATDADPEITTSQTGAGQVVGVSQLKSPGQVQANKSRRVSRWDLYAHGVMLYDLLTGRRPYDIHGKTMLQAIRIVHEDEPDEILHGASR